MFDCSSLLPFVIAGGSCFIYVIYVYGCPTRFLCQMMFMPFNSNTMVVTSETGTANPSTAHEIILVFSWVRVTQSLVFCVMFCRSLFVLLSFSIRHCFVCSSLTYEFWLPLWYLQTLLTLCTLNVPTITINLDHSETAFFSTLTLWSPFKYNLAGHA